MDSATDKQGLYRPESAADSDHEDQGDGDNSMEPLARVDKVETGSPTGQCTALLYAVLDYSQSFWVLFVMTFLLIGVQVPFNSIHAGFLQMRWYHDDPQKGRRRLHYISISRMFWRDTTYNFCSSATISLLLAAQIMTVPDLLSSILVLPVGYFVDHYGQKSWLFMLCGLIIGFSHFVLGIIPISTPVPALMALGIASAIGAIITSAIPTLVKSHQIATA
jgi:F0F1-type ATP synthase assembly protein I